MSAAPALHDELPFPVSARDLDILSRAAATLGPRRADFAAVVEALCKAVEAVIPSGRVYLLAPGPVVGSVVSGVGVAPGPIVVRVTQGRVEPLGDL